MPMTPDMPDDDVPAGARPNGSERNTASRAANDTASDDTFDDGGDIYEDEDQEDMEQAAGGQSFSDMVRQAPVGAMIGAFVVGFLVSRIL